MLQKSTIRVALAMLVLLPSLSMAAPLRPRDPELDEIITSDPIENQAHPVNHVPHIGHEEDYNHDNTAYIDKPEPSNHPVHHHGHHHHHDHHESLKEEASKAALEYLPYADITGGLLGIFEHVLPLDYHHGDKHHPHPHPHHHSHHHGHHAHHHLVHHGRHDHHHGHGSHVGHHHHHHHDTGHHGVKLVPWVHDELFDTGYFGSEAYLDTFYDDIDYEDVVLHILESLSRHHGHGHRVSVHDGHHSEKAPVTVTGAVSDLD